MEVSKYASRSIQMSKIYKRLCKKSKYLYIKNPMR